MLNLPDAMQLAQILLPYMPPDADEISVLAFSDKIMTGIVAAGKPNDYLRMVYLMSGIDPDTLVTKPIGDVYQLFIQGLQDNEILTLIEFYRRL